MLDLILVVLFILYSLWLGLRARSQASRSLVDYFLAGRTLSGTSAGSSMAATQFAADTPLLVSGLIASGGVFLLWRLWIYGLAFLLLAFVFGVLWRRSGVLTDAELTEIRYSGKGVLFVRSLKAIYYGGVINCTVLAMVLIAALRITEIFLPWHEWIPASVYDDLLLLSELPIPLGESISGLPLSVHRANSVLSIAALLLFVAIYSMTGGLRAVVATDVMQLAVMMVGTALYAYYAIDGVGGIDGMRTQLESLYPPEEAGRFTAVLPPLEESYVPFITLVALQWLFQMNSDGTGYLAQRTMGCRSDADARFAAVFFTWMQIIIRSFFWVLIGLALLVMYPISPDNAAKDTFVASRELLFATGIHDLLPPGVRGLMLTGMLAALASTVDTHLNWGAGYFSNDLYRRLICEHFLKRAPKNRELVTVARMSNLLVILVSLAIMSQLGSIQAAWEVSLLFGAGVGSVLVLRWLWERVNVYCELGAILTSIIAGPLILLWIENPATELLLMAAVNTFVVVVIALFGPPTDEIVLQHFFQRIRPPGWWLSTWRWAGAEGQNPLTRLYRNLGITAAAAVSLYAALIGVLNLALSGFTWFSLGAILVSAVFFPLWWPAVREES